MSTHRIGTRMRRRSHRSLLAVLLFGAASIAHAGDAPPRAPGYAFDIKQARSYVYDLRQDVTFASAGDTLTYVTTMRWTFAMIPLSVAPERVELAVSLVSLKAAMDGPGTHHAFDLGDRDPDRRRDPLFAHLAALYAARFVVTVDPRTGEVSAVGGGDAVAAAIAKSEPSKVDPSEPSPLAAAANAVYGSASLARMWSELLALPADHPQHVPLSGPFTGELERRWKGSAFTWQLPEGVDHIDVQLGRDPVQATGRMTEVAGGGRVDPVGGMPGTAGGELSFTLTLAALTQPVTQHHKLQWKLAPLATASGTPRP